MNYIVIVSDIVSACFLAIVLVGSYCVNKEALKRTTAYRLCVWVCLLCIVVDAAGWISLQPSTSPVASVVLNFLAYAGVDILTAAFGYYLYTFIRERDKSTTPFFPLLMVGIGALDIVFLIVGLATGNVGVYEGGEVIGAWEPFTVVGPALSLITVLSCLVAKHKVMGRNSTIVFAFYLVFPVVASIVALLFPLYKLGYVASALELTLIYVVIQIRIVADSNVRLELTDALLKKDALTGIENRRAYNERLNSVGPDEDMGVIFCDINRLKYINDNYGHEAGDFLIKRAATLFVDSFPGYDVFRISGDEFVIMTRADDQSKFLERISSFGDALEKNENIAAFGHSYGKGKDILRLIKSAETMMYDHKAKYYESTGVDRRRN